MTPSEKSPKLLSEEAFVDFSLLTVRFYTRSLERKPVGSSRVCQNPRE
jgi:hypothetical protein